jgi:uncharacterized membrane protein YGL010W
VVPFESLDERTLEYAASHENPLNKFFHAIGIPLIALSVAMFAAGFIQSVFWLIAAMMFVAGWLLQFLGHWIEGRPPNFLRDPRFLLVGSIWWLSKLRKRISRPQQAPLS